jgi:hypothetical protein
MSQLQTTVTSFSRNVVWLSEVPQPIIPTGYHKTLEKIRHAITVGVDFINQLQPYSPETDLKIGKVKIGLLVPLNLGNTFRLNCQIKLFLHFVTEIFTFDEQVKI